MQRQLDRYIVRSLLGPLVAIVAALSLVMLLDRALRLSQQMMVLGISGGYLPPLMAQLVPYYLAQAIPAAFVAALVIVISRMASNHEWEAMAAAGVPPRAFARPMVLVAGVLAMTTLAVSGWLEPVGRYGYRTLFAQALSESRIRNLQPAAIYSPVAHAMLTSDAVGKDGMHNVLFWAGEGNGHEIVATASRARAAIFDAPPLLRFSLGNGIMITADDKLVEFARLSFDIPLDDMLTRRERGRDARELTISELVRQDGASLSPRQRDERNAEIFGRFFGAFAIFFLPWIALPLLHASRAVRRWPAVALIMAVVVTYYHGVNLSRNLAASGALDIRHAAIVATLSACIGTALIWRFGGGGGQRAHSPLQWIADLPIFQRLQTRKRSMLWARPLFVLSGYLAQRLITMTLALLLGLTLVQQLIDLLERGEDLIGLGAGLQDFALYAWYRLPATLLQAAPIAMLGGALLVLVRMVSDSELVVIHGMGISPTGVLVRLLPTPLALGLVMIAIAEFWAPRAQVEYAAWWQSLHHEEQAIATAEPRWFRMGNELVRASLASADGKRLANACIYQRNTAGRLQGRTCADRATWTGHDWQLERAVIWRDATRETLAQEQRHWQTNLTPASVRRFFAAPSQVSGREASAALLGQAPVAFPASLYQTRILMNLSLALLPLVMVMLAVAMLVGRERGMRLPPLLFGAAVSGLSFLLANGYFQAQGQVGSVPSWLAVILAPLLFASGAIAVLLRVERAR